MWVFQLLSSPHQQRSQMVNKWLDRDLNQDLCDSKVWCCYALRKFPPLLSPQSLQTRYDNTLSPTSGGIIRSWSYPPRCFLMLLTSLSPLLLSSRSVVSDSATPWTMPGFPILHCLPEFAQTHVHWVSDALRCHASCNSLPHWMELICVVSGILWTVYSECLLRRFSP